MNKERFIWLMKNSIRITSDKHPESIFYYMDQNIERQMKLMSVLDINEPITVKLNNVDKTKIFFELDTKKNILWIDYEKIWEKIELKKENKDSDIWSLVDGWLKDKTNWNDYTPPSSIVLASFVFDNDENWKNYTNISNEELLMVMLNKDTIWKTK